jgi:hypothetical protein
MNNNYIDLSRKLETLASKFDQFVNVTSEWHKKQSKEL